MKNPIRFGLNIDHVATLRNARGGRHPDPLRAAQVAKQSGVDSITIHLREDRRHIRDSDLLRLKDFCGLPLNLEMAATDEMLHIALKVLPHAVCLVPEKREELTTEGGIDIFSMQDRLKRMLSKLNEAGIRTALFINPDVLQVHAAAEVGAKAVELHTGRYCDAEEVDLRLEELKRLQEAARATTMRNIECHAGHGIAFDTVVDVAAIAEVQELNIGHFIIGEAIFSGLENTLKQMRHLMDKARV